ncbi:MAG TPA: hypothetical protein VGG03_01765 [Thermoanaerobaculia bacterium]
MTPEARERAEQFVRPLYAGLDGVQTFDRVERLRARLAVLREGTAADEDLLELLLLFHGAVDRLGTLAAGGRLDLFLRGLDLPEDLPRRVRAGLGRLAEDPRGPEEELLHDALLLESAGVVAAAERLMAAGKKRTPLARALAQLDPGPPAERYRTARGATLGAARRREAEEWIATLRRKVAEEGFS